MTRRKIHHEDAKTVHGRVQGEDRVGGDPGSPDDWRLATRHELHPNLITQWRRQAIEKLARVFDDKTPEVQANRDAEVTKLHAKIGQLVVDRDFLAKAFDR